MSRDYDSYTDIQRNMVRKRDEQMERAAKKEAKNQSTDLANKHPQERLRSRLQNCF